MSSGKVSPGWKLVRAHVDAGRVIVGIDEVGRGSWAGPVTAAAVILPPLRRFVGINDSKLLAPATRVALDKKIRAAALAVGVGWVSADELNEHGLSWAVKQSGLRALEDMLGGSAHVDHYDVVILDGNHNYLQAEFADEQDPRSSEVYVKADQKIVPVAAASIVAKVARDAYMVGLSAAYPAYDFASNKGYICPAHARALTELGPIDGVHRTSWRPFARAADD
jgi:ribonuclease HII